MHVILKPFIKLMIWVVIIMGIAQLTGVDLESLVNDAKDALEGAMDQAETEE